MIEPLAPYLIEGVTPGAITPYASRERGRAFLNGIILIPKPWADAYRLFARLPIGYAPPMTLHAIGFDFTTTVAPCSIRVMEVGGSVELAVRPQEFVGETEFPPVDQQTSLGFRLDAATWPLKIVTTPAPPPGVVTGVTSTSGLVR